MKYTLTKKILTKSFVTLIGIFLIMYFAMFWFVLVWAVLAAVLNPQRFLPYAAAAMTLFTTITLKLIYYRMQYRNIMKNFDRIITEKINLLVE